MNIENKTNLELMQFGKAIANLLGLKQLTSNMYSTDNGFKSDVGLALLVIEKTTQFLNNK